MSKALILLGVCLLVVVMAMMFVSQFAFATVTDTAGASTAPQTAAGVTSGITLCGAAFDRNQDGKMDTWDRNNDGVMDAFDVNFDGIVDRWDESVSCGSVSGSKLPSTGAPTLALIAVATAMMGAGFMLRRSPR